MRSGRAGVLLAVLGLCAGCATQRAAETSKPRDEAPKTKQEEAAQAVPDRSPPLENIQFLSPPQILDRLEKSKVQYDIQDRSTFTAVYPKGYPKALWPQKTEPLDTPHVVEVNGRRSLQPYPFDPKSEAPLQEAEALFEKGDYAEALKKYVRLTADFPTHYLAWAYQGDCLLNLGDAEGALKMYDRAIALNPDDYRLPFFRSSALMHLGRIEEARKDIALSLVLHPRNNLLRDLLDERPPENSEFLGDVIEPQAFVRAESPERVIIYWDKKNPAWLAWANCKALWLGEPSHRKEMTGTEAHEWSNLEEDECLLNLSFAYRTLKQAGKAERDPKLERLNAIVEDRRLNELVMFELAPRVYPQVLLTLGPELRKRMVDFVLKHVLVEVPPAQAAR